jgi:hypothetical protein
MVPFYRGKRLYIAPVPSIINLSPDSANWFCGFADAESTFAISFRTNGAIKGFIFRIELHYDDRDVLIRLCQTTG